MTEVTDHARRHGDSNHDNDLLPHLPSASKSLASSTLRHNLGTWTTGSNLHSRDSPLAAVSHLYPCILPPHLPLSRLEMPPFCHIPPWAGPWDKRRESDVHWSQGQSWWLLQPMRWSKGRDLHNPHFLDPSAGQRGPTAQSQGRGHGWGWGPVPPTKLPTATIEG